MWAGRLLRSLAVEELDDLLLAAMREETDTRTCTGLIELLSDQAGQEEIELNRIRAGEYFGEMAIFQDDHDPIAVRTPNGARLLTLSKEAFHKIVYEHPEIGLYACRVLTRRIRRLHTKIKQSADQEKNAGE